MFYSWRDTLRRSRFALSVRGILDSPPLRLDSSLDLTVVTQLQHKDLLMYLGAIKSFCRQVPVSDVRVLDDGTLTEGDRSVLQRHVPGIQIERVRDYRRADLPVGGCWERLTAIAEVSRTRYVIQLDSDTLALAPLPEVVQAVRANRAFAIGTWDGQMLEEMTERAHQAREVSSKGAQHVQVIAEASFDQIQGAESLRYVRGCAGFSGFAVGEGKVDLMRRLSREIEALIGAAWREWGSEQVMSNIVVANTPKAIVLPHPDYSDCTKMRFPGTRFVHFIGSCRFARGKYAELLTSLEL